MKRGIGIAIFAALMTAVSFCQSATHTPSGQPAKAPAAGTLKHHGTFTVELLKALDSRKLKSGDIVETKLAGGITLPDGSTVPGGAKVMGHITEVRARSKSESGSSLGISFDKIATPGGDVPIQGLIQAVAPNPNEDLTTGGPVDYGVDEEKATTVAAAPYTGHGPAPLLDETSHGVLGIRNLHLDANGVLTSTGKEVKLDSGTRILLNVMMQ
jgi:hypothetical protein